MIQVFLVAILLIACGSDNDSSSDEGLTAVASGASEIESEAEPPQTGFASLVPTDSDLPSCDESSRRHIVYVKETKSFRECANDGSWEVLLFDEPKPLIRVTEDPEHKDCDYGARITEIGMDADANAELDSSEISDTQIECLPQPARVITRYNLISPITKNLCADGKNTYIWFCYFNGGQLVEYSDGSVLLTGAMSRSDVFIDTDSDLSVDTDQHSISMMIPPGDSAWQRLTGRFSDNTSEDIIALYMVFDRTPSGYTLQLRAAPLDLDYSEYNSHLVAKLEVTEW